jgi:hypothetical protein
MIRTILIYGALSGAVVVGVMILGIVTSNGHGHGLSSEAVGYLTMLIALSSIFVAVKNYRDDKQGGALKFLPALGMGLGIAAVAGAVYVAAWEVYLATTGYAFIGDYIAAQTAALKARGVSGESLAAATREMEMLRRSYANPLMRIPMTFLEIFPVGLLVALVSAALLRNPRFMPKRPSLTTPPLA